MALLMMNQVIARSMTSLVCCHRYWGITVIPCFQWTGRPLSVLQFTLYRSVGAGCVFLILFSNEMEKVLFLTHAIAAVWSGYWLMKSPTSGSKHTSMVHIGFHTTDCSLHTIYTWHHLLTSVCLSHLLLFRSLWHTLTQSTGRSGCYCILYYASQFLNIDSPSKEL